MFNRIYRFIRGPDNLGVGTGAEAFQQPTTVPIQSIYGPAYNVRRQLAPNSPGFAKMRHSVVPVSMLGTSGTSFAGQMALQTLAQLEAEK